MRTDFVFLGRVNWRDDRRWFRSHAEDRHAHLYVIGKTGTGKSSLLEGLVRQDIAAGRGLALFDPHGDLVERVSAFAISESRRDVICLDVPNPAATFAFNPLEAVPELRRSFAAEALIETFKKLFDTWGVRLEHFFRHALLLLLDQPEATLADVPRLFLDNNFRKAAIEHVTHPQVEAFWTLEFEKYPARARIEAVAPLMNKIGAFLANPFLHRILATPRSTFRLREVMDSRGVLLVNLSKGKIGEGPAALFGGLLMASIGIAGLSRSDSRPAERNDFYVYGDEFQTYTTLAVANMLSELRKYGVSLTLANQYLDQIEPEVRSAIVGNVGTLVAFRVGAEDAERLVKHFEPEFEAQDLIALPNRSFVIRMLVRGEYVRPFSGKTIDVETLGAAA